MTIDEMIDLRKYVRQGKNYQASDDIRTTLDKELVFVFDHKDGSQEVHYLTDAYFRHMHKTQCRTKREYVEHRMRQDREAEQRLNAWLYTIRS
jgi:cysteinyl-tRNA synthetase